MVFLKRFFKWFLIILLILNLFILISGNTYLYKAIGNTYLKGRGGPSIDEYLIFDNREIKSGEYQAWPLGKDYNTKQVRKELLSDFNRLQTIGFVVIKNDSVRHEQYWEGFSDSSHTNSFSMAKTVLSILVGIAIDEGKIKSVDEPVSNYLPEFKNGKNALLTIKHLLCMCSGINFDESYINPLSYPAKSYYGDDLSELTLKYEVTETPGNTFDYVSGNTQLLGMVLEKAVGMNVSDYLSEKLWKPMGARYPAYWSLDKKGMEKTFCCMNSNATDFARFGQLFLKNGNWKGKQLVSEDYVKASIVPADMKEKDGRQNNRYGYSWWMLTYKGHYIYYARGILGQYIFVIPDENMVVVRLGVKRDRVPGEDHPRDIYFYLDAALELFAKKNN